jgi:hypothetical protein
MDDEIYILDACALIAYPPGLLPYGGQGRGSPQRIVKDVCDKLKLTLVAETNFMTQSV